MESNNDDRLSAIEKKLDDTYMLVLKMRKSQRTATIVRALYWVFIILLGFGAFYFVQPYLGQLGAAYGLTNDDGSSAINSSNSANIKELLNQLKGQQQANQ